MGWDFCDAWKTIDDVMSAIRFSLKAGGCSILAEGKTKGCLWFAVEKDNQRWIEMALYEKDINGKSYGYKEMSERVHPYYYDVPINVFACVENHLPPNKSAEQWREKVRERR